MTDAHAKAVEAAARAARELAIPHTNKIEPWNAASTAERSVWLGHAQSAITAYLAAMRAEGWVMVRDCGEEMQDGSTIIQKDDASVLNGMLDRWEKLYPDWDIDWPERTQGAKP